MGGADGAGRRLGWLVPLASAAEGVETHDAGRKLEALDCDTAQGYYLGRPMPATELEHWLGEPANHRWSRRPRRRSTLVDGS